MANSHCSSDGGEGQTALSPPLTSLNEPLFEQQPTTRVRRLLKASRPPALPPPQEQGGGGPTTSKVGFGHTHPLSLYHYLHRPHVYARGAMDLAILESRELRQREMEVDYKFLFLRVFYLILAVY